MGAVCGSCVWELCRVEEGLLGLNHPCWVLQGLRENKDDAHSQKSDRGEGKVQEGSLEEEISLAGKGWLDLEHRWDKLEGYRQRTQ